MRSNDPHRSGFGGSYRLVGLGGTFAAAIIGFMLGGWFLDRWLGTIPLFTLVGTGVGAVLGFLDVYWKLRAEIEREKSERAKKRGHS